MISPYIIVLVKLTLLQMLLSRKSQSNLANLSYYKWELHKFFEDFDLRLSIQSDQIHLLSLFAQPNIRQRVNLAQMNDAEGHSIL